MTRIRKAYRNQHGGQLRHARRPPVRSR